MRILTSLVPVALGLVAVSAGCDAAHSVADAGASASDAPAPSGDALHPFDARITDDRGRASLEAGAPFPDTGALPSGDAAATATDAAVSPSADAAAPPPSGDGGGSTLEDAGFVFVDGGMVCGDGQPARRFFPDADGDGYGDVVDLSGLNPAGCDAPAGYVANDQDCDDGRATTNPSASESCNGFDDDCDGRIDNDASNERAFYADADADGFGDFYGEVVFACDAPMGFADNLDDCDDESPQVGVCPAGQFCSQARLCLPEGECRGGRDCGAGLICNDAGRCEPGSLCGGQSYAAARILPNLLIVLDRSCSMRARVGDVRKWQAAVDAIAALTRQYEGQIRFGLSLFPDLQGLACAQSDIVLPVADANEAPIRDLLTAALNAGDRYWPDGPCVTNIDTAMEQAATEPRLADPEQRGFAMLVTDGQQSACNLAGSDRGTEDIIGQLNARGVPTFVVGFGGEVDARQLDAFAIAGGVARADAPRYYQADDAAGLLAALQNIGSQVVSCDFALEADPPNLFDIHVFFDNQEEVRHDIGHMDGWDYDPATRMVSFYGMACDRLTQRIVSDVDVVFGCPSGNGQ